MSPTSSSTTHIPGFHLRQGRLPVLPQSLASWKTGSSHCPEKHLSGAFCRVLCENASNQTPHLQHYEHEQTQLDSIIYQEYCNRGIINCNSILLYIQSLHAQCSASFVRTRGAYLAISFTYDTTVLAVALSTAMSHWCP